MSQRPERAFSQYTSCASLIFRAFSYLLVRERKTMKRGLHYSRLANFPDCVHARVAVRTTRVLACNDSSQPLLRNRVLQSTDRTHVYTNR
jgi:hypothetical protein